MGAVAEKGRNEKDAHRVHHQEGMRCSCGSPFWPRDVSVAFSCTPLLNIVNQAHINTP